MVPTALKLLSLCLVTLMACQFLAAEESDLAELFAAGKFKEGTVLAVKLLEQHPDNADLLYTGGLAAYLSDDSKTASRLWQRLKLAEKQDLKLRAKLIQAYEADGATAECAKEIAELYELYKSTPALFTDMRFFIRDQFLIKTQRVMVFEYFAIQGERAVKYKFNLLDGDGEVESTFSLGSYDVTNEVMQNDRKLPNDERYYHLDGYSDGGASHRTFGFYSGLPSYGDVKKAVIGAADGSKKAVSGTDAK